MRMDQSGGAAVGRARPADRRRFQDGLLFLAKWLRSPMKVAAVMPSGPDLAATMAAEVPAGADGWVLELGGGTGALTRGILDRGVPEERLIVVERDPGFARILRERFPAAHVVEGDAGEIAAAVAAAGASGERPLTAVVSGLPILTFPAPLQERILKGCFALLRPGGAFVQFTYGFGPPVPAERLARWGLKPVAAGHALKNVPPAHVWKFVRRDDA
jgi:phosphatidylethanolamine/phosphatidyl-N-methylethanolamine N-methyltransferase